MVSKISSRSRLQNGNLQHLATICLDQFLNKGIQFGSRVSQQLVDPHFPQVHSLAVSLESYKLNCPGCVFFAEGGKLTGMGHLSRSAILAHYLERLGVVNSTILAVNDPYARQFMESRREVLYIDPEEVDKGSLLEAIWSKVRAVNPRIFILDVVDALHYRKLLQKIQQTGCCIVVYGDSTERYLGPADIYVNGNPAQLEYRYSSDQFLVGPEYFVMDPGYSNLETPMPKKSASKVFLSLGGVDRYNLILGIVPMIFDSVAQVSLTIVTSRASGYADELESLLRDMPGKLALLFDPPSLCPLWGGSDVAITAGGNTLFERVASGTPGITICQQDQQMATANLFQELGANINLGLGSSLALEDLRYLLSDLILDDKKRLNQYKAARSLNIGRGIEHLTRCILEKLNW